ncbi:MAG TPA: serine protease [Solirubrobacteraceae bacterium]
MPRLLVLAAVAAALALPAQAGAVSGRDVRIVGGAIGAPGQFPWMAGLVDASARNASNGLFCGGSVIAPRVVLTAAHCLDGVRPGELDVVVGRTRISTDTDGDRVGVTQILTHPGWDADEVVNDLGLVQLASAATVQPIGLPRPEDAPLAQPGARAFTSGWGATAEGGATSDDVRYVRLTVRSTAACTTVYGRIDGRKQLCASSSRAGQDSCQGDSGGPFFAGEGATARLLGIVSFGRGCGRRGTPGVYTRVAAFDDWIAQNAAVLNGDAPAPPPPVDPPRVRIGSIRCGAILCTIQLRVTGRAPAGGILLNASRPRRGSRRAVDRFTFAREVSPGRWTGRLNLPVGRMTLYAFPLDAEQDDLDGDGDVERLVITVG